MTAKIIIKDLDGFSDQAGKELFRSDPLLITQERIHDFCRAVDNDEWVHWDEARCIAAGLGGIIMPAFMGPALMSKAYFDHVELQNIEGLFAGVNRLRLIRPVTAGQSIYQRWSVAEVTTRIRGIAVIYHVEWYATDHDEPVIVAEYVLRYW